MDAREKQARQLAEAQERSIRNLAGATLRIYGDIERATEALTKLYVGQEDQVGMQEPVVGPGGVMLLDEALGWVACETNFRDQRDGESGVEWLRAYLATDRKEAQDV